MKENEKKYCIGIDFGTLSGRALLLDAVNGEEKAESVFDFPHAVMDKELPCGRKLPDQYALQHPGDYIEVLSHTVPDVLKKAGVSPDEVAGIGIDFTACTILPIRADGTPLCLEDRFENEPHAYVKLWKHHAAQYEADRINRVASERGERWLQIYGGKISSEWLLPKVLQVLDEAPLVYEAADRFIEAGDWISLVLTGTETRAAAFAGYKALWSEHGYPENDFFAALDGRLSGFAEKKLAGKVTSVDGKAGVLSRHGAEITGLPEGTPIALPMIDAHAAMPALGITKPGQLMIIVGTSSCHILNASKGIDVPGICGYVKDSVIPGCYTYEAGQPSVGDTFDWFVRTCVPEEYSIQARQRNISIHELLCEKASMLYPGESGLLALDWFNGNRSVLVNADLSGLILGLTLKTRPEEIYRALLEATAFGTKMIIDTFRESGIPINHITAAGGIAQKNPMMMQIYADVTGLPIHISGTTQAGARGSAIYASAASGIYPDIAEASRVLSVAESAVWYPNEKNTETYGKIYDDYTALQNYFGVKNSGMMKNLLTVARAEA